MKKVIILRHGRDTEKDERPLVPEEFEDLKKIMKVKVVEALGGPVEKAFSSPLLRAKQTAQAVCDGTEIIVVETLGKFPKFRPEVKQIASEKGIDTSKSFFEVEGLNEGLQLSREQGGSEIFNFIKNLKSENAERIVIVSHGGSVDAVAAEIKKDFEINDVLEKGEGYLVELDDDNDELKFGGFLRR